MSIVYHKPIGTAKCRSCGNLPDLYRDSNSGWTCTCECLWSLRLCGHATRVEAVAMWNEIAEERAKSTQ